MNVLLLFTLFFSVFSHDALPENSGWLMVNKFSGDDCTGNISQIAVTEFDHCVSTKTLSGGIWIDINVKYYKHPLEHPDKAKLDAYFFRFDCLDDLKDSLHSRAAKVKEITVGDDCFENFYKYELFETRQDALDYVNPILDNQIEIEKYGAIVEVFGSSDCTGTVHRWEFNKAWGTYCTAPSSESRCDTVDDDASNQVQCFGQNKEFEESGITVKQLAIGALSAVGVGAIFVIGIGVVIVVLVLFILRKNKEKEVEKTKV